MFHIQILKNYNKNQTNRNSPPSQTGSYSTLQPQLNSSPLHPEKNNAVSPVVENECYSLVENHGMNGGNDKNLLRLPATIRGNEIDDSFKQYLLAQRKRNLKQILLKAARHGHILQTGDAYLQVHSVLQWWEMFL
jgi:hypothetical protein